MKEFARFLQAVISDHPLLDSWDTSALSNLLKLWSPGFSLSQHHPHGEGQNEAEALLRSLPWELDMGCLPQVLCSPHPSLLNSDSHHLPRAGRRGTFRAPITQRSGSSLEWPWAPAANFWAACGGGMASTRRQLEAHPLDTLHSPESPGPQLNFDF